MVGEHPLGLASLWSQRAEHSSEADEAGAVAEPITTWKFRPGDVSQRISDYIWCDFVEVHTEWLSRASLVFCSLGVHAASPAPFPALLQTVQCRAAGQVLARPAAQAAAALAGAHGGGDRACGAADCALALGPCGAVRCV